MTGREGAKGQMTARGTHSASRNREVSPVRGNKTILNKYYDIAGTILNNSSSSDLEELFINSARDGAYERLQNFLNRHGDSLISVDLKDKRTGNTALIWAAKRGHIKITQLLLRHGADITLRNYDGKSALEVASPVIKSMLLDFVEQGTHQTPQRLSQAAWVGNVQVVSDLLTTGKVRDVDCRNADGFTPLLLATRDVYMFEKLGTQLVKNYNPLRVVQELIAYRADTSARDDDGKTALHYSSLSKASVAVQLTNLLVHNGHVELRDKRNLAALHYGCQVGNTDTVTVLLNAGAEVNARGFAGTTPLHIAAYNNHESVAMILLNNGADSRLNDDSGQSPIDVAKTRKLKALLKSVVDSTGNRVDLAPVRGPSTPRQRQFADSRPSSNTRLDTALALDRGNSSTNILQKILSPVDEATARIQQREGTRLLGAPRGGRSNSRELLTPLTQHGLTHQHGRHNVKESLRSHSTSEVPETLKARGDNQACDRGDGVISVEVLGLTSADRRRRQEVFYERTTPQHDHVIISNHNAVSPVMNRMPSNLPDINSPMLSTIPELTDTLPRSVMMDSDKLRGTSPEKLLHRRNSNQGDSSQSGSRPSSGTQRDQLRSIIKAEFVLDESRTTEYRSQPSQHDNKGKTKDKAISNSKNNGKTGTANKLRAVAMDNAAHHAPSSHLVPQTIVKTILDQSVMATEDGSPKKGKITMHHGELLLDGETPQPQPKLISTQESVDKSSEPIKVTSTISVPMSVARAKTIMPKTATSASTKPKVTVLNKRTGQTTTTNSSPMGNQGGATSTMTNTKPTNATSATTSSMSGKYDRPSQQAVGQNSKPTNKIASSNRLAVTKLSSNNLQKPKVDKAKTPSPRYPPNSAKSPTKIGTTHNTPAAKPVSQPTPRQEAPVSKINTNIFTSHTKQAESPRRPDRPLVKKVSYGNRSASSADLKDGIKQTAVKQNTVTMDRKKMESVGSQLNKPAAGGESNIPPANTQTNIQNSVSSVESQANNVPAQANTQQNHHTAPTGTVNQPLNNIQSMGPNTKTGEQKSPDSVHAPSILQTGGKPQETQGKSALANSQTSSSNINGLTTKTSTQTPPKTNSTQQEVTPAQSSIRTPDQGMYSYLKERSTISAKSTRSTSGVVPFGSQMSYQPLHMLMGGGLNPTTSQLKENTPPASANHDPPHSEGSPKKKLSTQQAEVSGHSADSGISSSEKLEADKALTLTFSQHPAPLSPVKTTPQYEGPVIEDVYENFPRPLYDIAVIVAEDLAKNKAQVTNKKKKKKPVSRAGESRGNSGARPKRTKAVQADTSKRGKSARKRKAKTSSTTMDEPVKLESEKTAVISGVDWHITAERSSDVEVTYKDSDTDGATTCDDSDGEGITKRGHKRSYSFQEMSPRQKKEELKNLLLLMKNPDVATSATSSLLPETMQAIQEFVNAVPNEHEFNKLFGLDTSEGRLIPAAGEASEETHPDMGDTSGPEDSIPDVSEIDLGAVTDEEPNELLKLSPTPEGQTSSRSQQTGERCVSTAMTVIIDEILAPSPRSPSPRQGFRSPRRKLPDSLVREIHEEWEKASHSDNPSLTASDSMTPSSQSTSYKSSGTDHSTSLNQTVTTATTGHSDSESKSETSSDSTSNSSDESQAEENETEAKEKPPSAYQPMKSAASPAPKLRSKSSRNKALRRKMEEQNSSGSKKGTFSFSEVESLPVLFPTGAFDERSLTDSLKSNIMSRPNSRTVTSRLGARRVSIPRGDEIMASLTHRSTNSDDQILRWKKGNLLGKGAYGTVYCGLTSDGHLIAVKQMTLNVHDWEKAEKEYEGIQEEVELLKNLKHQNIVGFLGTSLDEHVVSIFMQFVPGGTIASLLSRFGAFEERVFQRYTLQIVQGVNYLHDNGVIHRDIKGANIMLMSNGVIKLIDFGCAKRLCLNLSMSQSQLLKSMKGTPYWMAPEVIKETGHGYKSDIWSIGCTVFEMATTKPPWSEMQPMTAIFAIGSDKPLPALPDICTTAAREFVSACMQRDQTRRKSAKELLETEFLANMDLIK